MQADQFIVYGCSIAQCFIFLYCRVCNGPAVSTNCLIFKDWIGIVRATKYQWLHLISHSHWSPTMCLIDSVLQISSAIKGSMWSYCWCEEVHKMFPIDKVRPLAFTVQASWNLSSILNGCLSVYFLFYCLCTSVKIPYNTEKMQLYLDTVPDCLMW